MYVDENFFWGEDTKSASGEAKDNDPDHTWDPSLAEEMAAVDMVLMRLAFNCL